MNRVTIDDLVAQAERAFETLTQVRGLMLSPDAEKKAPTFSAASLAAMCGIDKHQLHYRLGKGDLPTGAVGKSNRREFSLAQARAWVTAYRGGSPRPAGRKAITIAVANFKGGVSKTTTTMTLSQGLSLRGYRVLTVDLDPQGSLTTLFGVLPDVEVQEDQTVLPLLAGEQGSARYAIHESYWDGIDFIPANSQLFNAEMMLPSYHMRGAPRGSDGRAFAFWDVLNRGLDDVRNDYDVIIIDTAPALSYLTINALMAADGLIVPLPPSALDFASSVQFWSLFSDIANGLRERSDFQKTYEFVRVLLARVDLSDAATLGVQQWITATYAEKVFPVEIPKTAVALASSADFGTVYDVVRYEGSAKTYQRARAAYDRVAELLDQILVQCWKRQGDELREAA